MPSEEPMSSKNSDEAVKEEVDYDSDNTVLYEPEENDLVCYTVYLFIFLFNVKYRIMFDYIDFWRWRPWMGERAAAIAFV